MTDRRIDLLALLALFSCCAPVLAAEGSFAEGNGQEFRYSFDHSEVDYRNDTARLSGNVRVDQGSNSIEAEQATVNAFRSDNSRWHFEGAVRVRTADAALQSQSASAVFENEQLVRARVEGSPAEFERLGGPDDLFARGRARVIEYDVTSDVVTLNGDVWFGYGEDVFETDTVVYYIRDERVSAGGSADGRVRGVIRPRQTETSEAKPQTAPAQEAAPGGTAKQNENESGA